MQAEVEPGSPPARRRRNVPKAGACSNWRQADAFSTRRRRPNFGTMVGTPRVMACSMRYAPLGRSAASGVRAVRRLADVARRACGWIDLGPVHLSVPQVPCAGGLYDGSGRTSHSCPDGPLNADNTWALTGHESFDSGCLRNLSIKSFLARSQISSSLPCGLPACSQSSCARARICSSVGFSIAALRYDRHVKSRERGFVPFSAPFAAWASCSSN